MNYSLSVSGGGNRTVIFTGLTWALLNELGAPKKVAVFSGSVLTIPPILKGKSPKTLIPLMQKSTNLSRYLKPVGNTIEEFLQHHGIYDFSKAMETYLNKWTDGLNNTFCVVYNATTNKNEYYKITNIFHAMNSMRIPGIFVPGYKESTSEYFFDGGVGIAAPVGIFSEKDKVITLLFKPSPTFAHISGFLKLIRYNPKYLIAFQKLINDDKLVRKVFSKFRAGIPESHLKEVYRKSNYLIYTSVDFSLITNSLNYPLMVENGMYLGKLIAEEIKENEILKKYSKIIFDVNVLEKKVETTYIS